MSRATTTADAVLGLLLILAAPFYFVVALLVGLMWLPFWSVHEARRLMGRDPRIVRGAWRP